MDCKIECVHFVNQIEMRRYLKLPIDCMMLPIIMLPQVVPCRLASYVLALLQPPPRPPGATRADITCLRQ
jgi:hypothetical protein